VWYRHLSEPKPDFFGNLTLILVGSYKCHTLSVEIQLVRIFITLVRVVITLVSVKITLIRIKITICRRNQSCACLNHSHECRNHIRACQITQRVEITLCVIVLVSVIRVKITLVCV
jgi:hypothetical protein